MNRLTKKINGCVYYTKGKFSETTPAECEIRDGRTILKKLAAYEDTGLPPEDIELLKKSVVANGRLSYQIAQENTKLQSENIKLKELLKKAVEDIRKLLTSCYGSECQFCRLLWSHPFWHQGKDKNTKGFSCELDKQKRVLKLPIDDTTTKAEWCSLKEMDVK